MTQKIETKTGYSIVNGINMYYEISGTGVPLVLIHGGGSTIHSSFGRIIPMLERNYQVIAMELQHHGRSSSRDTPQTFEQDADDIDCLLKNLGIDHASFLGFSNGGTTALQLAIRHPHLTQRLILVAAAFQRAGFIPGFFEGMNLATLADMPEMLKKAFLAVNPNTIQLQRMFNKDRERMIAFQDIDQSWLHAISVPVLLINGDQDVVMPEQAVALFRQIPHCQLAILPGIHGECIGEICTLGLGNNITDLSQTIQLIRHFLDKDLSKSTQGNQE